MQFEVCLLSWLVVINFRKLKTLNLGQRVANQIKDRKPLWRLCGLYQQLEMFLLLWSAHLLLIISTQKMKAHLSYLQVYCVTFSFLSYRYTMLHPASYHIGILWYFQLLITQVYYVTSSLSYMYTILHSVSYHNFVIWSFPGLFCSVFLTVEKCSNLLYLIEL